MRHSFWNTRYIKKYLIILAVAIHKLSPKRFWKNDPSGQQIQILDRIRWLSCLFLKKVLIFWKQTGFSIWHKEVALATWKFRYFKMCILSYTHKSLSCKKYSQVKNDIALFRNLTPRKQWKISKYSFHSQRFKKI